MLIECDNVVLDCVKKKAASANTINFLNFLMFLYPPVFFLNDYSFMDFRSKLRQN